MKECEGFLSRARAHLTELDAKRTTVSTNIRDAEQRLEALKQMQQFSSSGRGNRTPPVARDCCPNEGAIGSRETSDGGGTSVQASAGEKITSPIAWKSCRSGLRSPLRGNTTTKELQTCTFERPGASNTTKIQREDTQRGKKRTNFAAGQGKKGAKFWAPPFKPTPFANPHLSPPTHVNSKHIKT